MLFDGKRTRAELVDAKIWHLYFSLQIAFLLNAKNLKIIHFLHCGTSLQPIVYQ